MPPSSWKEGRGPRGRLDGEAETEVRTGDANPTGRDCQRTGACAHANRGSQQEGGQHEAFIAWATAVTGSAGGFRVHTQGNRTPGSS